MTTDQDLPMEAQSAAAVFAASGIDVTADQDQGVIKVPFPPLFQLRSLTFFGRMIFLAAACEAPGAGWRAADDRGQGDGPLHWNAAQWEEVRLQPGPQGALLLQRGKRWVTSVGSTPRERFHLVLVRRDRCLGQNMFFSSSVVNVLPMWLSELSAQWESNPDPASVKPHSSNEM